MDTSGNETNGRNIGICARHGLLLPCRPCDGETWRVMLARHLPPWAPGAARPVSSRENAS